MALAATTTQVGIYLPSPLVNPTPPQRVLQVGTATPSGSTTLLLEYPAGGWPERASPLRPRS